MIIKVKTVAVVLGLVAAPAMATTPVLDATGDAVVPLILHRADTTHRVTFPNECRVEFDTAYSVSGTSGPCDGAQVASASSLVMRDAPAPVVVDQTMTTRDDTMMLSN